MLDKLTGVLPRSVAGHISQTAEALRRRPSNDRVVAVLEQVALLLTARISDPRELRPWIRSWGADVEVLEPDEPRAETVEQARHLAERYQSEAR